MRAPRSVVNGYPAAGQIAEIAGVAAPDYFVPTSAAGAQVIAADGSHDGSGTHPACTVVYNEATLVSGSPAPPGYAIYATPASCQ